MHLSFIASRAVQLQILIINLFSRDLDLDFFRRFYSSDEEIRESCLRRSFFQNLFDYSPANKNNYIKQIKALLSKVSLPSRCSNLELSEYPHFENTNIVCIFDFKNPEKIKAVICYEIEETFVYISALAVDPLCRRQGLGTLLLLCVVNHASLLGKQYLKLDNQSHYGPLFGDYYSMPLLPEKTFYQKLGFKTTMLGSDILILDLADPSIEQLFRQKGLVRRNSFSSFESLQHEKYQEKRVLHFFKKDAPFLPIF